MAKNIRFPIKFPIETKNDEFLIDNDDPVSANISVI